MNTVTDHRYSAKKNHFLYEPQQRRTSNFSSVVLKYYMEWKYVIHVIPRLIGNISKPGNIWGGDFYRTWTVKLSLPALAQFMSFHSRNDASCAPLRLIRKTSSSTEYGKLLNYICIFIPNSEKCNRRKKKESDPMPK